MASDNNSKHYDGVTNLFESILGEHIHVGYYREEENLKEASLALTQHLAKTVSLKSKQKVLDVGCGVGGPARVLASEFGASVTGISNSSVGVERARRANNPNNLDVKFELQDAMALKSSSFCGFDVVWLLESSHLMENKVQLFDNISSVTQTGGMFVLCDFFSGDMEFAEFLKNKKSLMKMRQIFKVFGTLHIGSVAEYKTLAIKSGFSSVCSEDITEQTLPTFDAWMAEAEPYVGKLAEAEQFITASKCLQELYQEGVLTYHLLSGVKT